MTMAELSARTATAGAALAVTLLAGLGIAPATGATVAPLQISKQVDAATARPGDTMHYTLTVRSALDQQGVMAFDVVPAGTEYVGGSCEPAPCGLAEGQLAWTIGALAAGTQQVLRFTVLVTSTVPQPGEIRNVAHASSPAVPSGVASAETVTTVPAPPRPPTGHMPIGHLDGVTGPVGESVVKGWALDPDTTAPIAVHVYVDGRAVRAVTADADRPDVATAFGWGAAHGFATTFVIGGWSEGPHLICVYGINTGAGTGNPLLGCATLPVRHSPLGHVDLVTRTPAGVRVGGWALDPDTTAPIAVHLYVDNRLLQGATASGDRPDVAAAFGLGPRHGYDTLLSGIAAGSHRVCVYAINIGAGVGNPLLSCRTLT